MTDLQGADRLQASQICTNRYEGRLAYQPGNLRAAFDAEKKVAFVSQDHSDEMIITWIKGSVAILAQPDGQPEKTYPFQSSRTVIEDELDGVVSDLPAEYNDLPHCNDDVSEGRCKTWWVDEIAGLMVR
jgi:hypothetical protein